MSYVTIMVYVEADEPPQQRVRIAAALADKFKATLIGISAVDPELAMAAAGSVVGAAMQADLDAMRGKLAQNGSWFQSIAAVPDRKLEWRAELELPREWLVRQARSADLVVIGKPKPFANIYTSLDSGGAILKMGRPALVVPEGVSSLAAAHVVIGWKDSREARRAVRDALALLSLAARITIVEACGEDDHDGAVARLNDVVLYLRRHGMDCDAEVVRQKGSGAAQLTELAQAYGADLLVTGAYGHSRLGEWMFGGMTQELLANSPICCLMSH